MTVRIVRLGSRRQPGEGLRIGTVRRPPRGVKKSDYAARDIYDVWLPNLAPSEPLLKMAIAARGSQRSGSYSGRSDDPAGWRRFVRRYRAEMKAAEPGRVLDLLAALSHHADFSVGCYCEDETRCHRSVLRELLTHRGAKIG